MKTVTGEEGVQTRLWYPTLTYVDLLSECEVDNCLPRLEDGLVPSPSTKCLTQYNRGDYWSMQRVEPGLITYNYWCKSCLEKLTGEKFD